MKAPVVDVFAPFVDYISFTTPPDRYSAVRGSIAETVYDAGGWLDNSADTSSFYRFPNGGTVKVGQTLYSETAAVDFFQISGKACQALVAGKVLLNFLGTLFAEPHRLTRLDLAVDLLGLKPYSLQRHCQKLSASRALQISRKTLDPSKVGTKGDAYGNIQTFYSDASRSSQVCMAVYDKRLETLNKQHLDIGYDLTRLELRFKSKVGFGLADIADPVPLFWHYAPRNVVQPSSEPVLWSPDRRGFELPPPRALDAIDRIQRMMRAPGFQAVLSEARELGPEAMALVEREVYRKFNRVSKFPTLGAALGKALPA
jgi:hypothetical protein